jgi:hypothetical protein
MKIIQLLAFAIASLASTATAASRSSANYLVPTDTVDAGGNRTASANYVIDASIGGLGGIGTAAAPVVLARHSYVGQLMQVVNLSLNTSPTNVNEGATRQLATFVVNDDTTSNSVPATQVAWSVVNGPIASIDANGLATAGNVYQNEPASVQGAFGGRVGALGLTVLNDNLDNFGIYAGDGIDDAWQVQFFGVGNGNALAGFDPDGDRQNNRFEYIAGTIPTNALSKFNLSIAEVSPERKDVTFEPRFVSRTYSVEYATDPGAGSFVPLGGGMVSDVGPIRTVRDIQATNFARYYRVFITYP